MNNLLFIFSCVLFSLLNSCSRYENVANTKVDPMPSVMVLPEVRFNEILRILSKIDSPTEVNGIFSNFSKDEVRKVVLCSFPDLVVDKIVFKNETSREGNFYVLLLDPDVRLTCDEFIDLSIGNLNSGDLMSAEALKLEVFSGNTSYEKSFYETNHLR